VAAQGPGVGSPRLQPAAAAAAGAGGADASGNSGSSAPDGQPALMTVGTDGIIRIFVEVVMADIVATPPSSTSSSTSTSTSKTAAPAGAVAGPASPPKAAAAAAAAATSAAAVAAAKSSNSMSQFCLTLVIEPPPGLAPQALAQKPGLMACWAQPLDRHNQSSLMWVLGSYMATATTGQMPLAAALSGVPPAAAAAAAAATAAEPLPWQDQVFLWGIDGLGSVVLSGIAQNAIMSNKYESASCVTCGAAAAARSAGAGHSCYSVLLLLQEAAVLGSRVWQHSLQAWVVESPAGPVVSAMQQYSVPPLFAATAANGDVLHSSSSSSSSSTTTRTWQQQQQQQQQQRLGGPCCLSESRRYQVTPLTGTNATGAPASAIAVHQRGLQELTGLADEWVQVTCVMTRHLFLACT